MNSRIKSQIALCSFLIGCVNAGLTLPAFAQHGGGGGGSGGEDEGPGSNLSFPNIFSEGIGLGGLAIDSLDPTTTGLRVPPIPPGYNLTGAYWYAWNGGGDLCNPATHPLECPPAPAPLDLSRLYLQRDANNSWQADWMVGMGQVDVGTVDWGDNIESHAWSTKQNQVRVEVGITKAVDPSLSGLLMTHVSGTGQSEMWGVASPDAIPGMPVSYESAEATIYSPCSRLTIQKLYPDAADPGTPPGDDFTWDPLTAKWAGPAYTVFNGAVWEGYGSEGPTVKFAAEVNIKGRIVYGFNWKVKDMTLPPHYRKVGWYRLTFSMDGTAPSGMQCGTFALNTSLRNAVIAIPVEEGDSEPLALEEEPGTGFNAVVDPVNNLTYIDIYIAAGLGDPTTNNPPVCNAGSGYTGACTGLLTNIALSADGSFDPDGDTLDYLWSHDCLNGTLSDATIQNPMLGLTEPGVGNAQNCTVTLRVTERDVSTPLSAECTASVAINACPIDCYGTPFGLGQLDLCGKCGGFNECLDCKGVPFGIARLDRCNICDGDGNGCLGCTGILVSPVLSEIRLQTRLQQRLVARAVNRIRAHTGNRTYARKQVKLVNQLNASNATLETSMGGILNACSNTEFCVKQDNSSVLKDASENTARMNTILRRMLKELRRHGFGGYANSLARRGKLSLSKVRQLVSAVPNTNDVCY